MDIRLSESNLTDDFNQIVASDEGKKWSLQRPEPLVVRASMAPLSAPTEVYYPQFRWASYPDQPPSMKFWDAASTTLTVPTAWPIIRGFRPQSLDACVNYCTEGFRLHPEWVKDSSLKWDSRANVLLKVLRILQDEFDEYYGGRFK